MSAVGRYSIAIGLVSAIACAAGCARLLGIDEPEVVGSDAGGAEAGVDAVGDAASDAALSRDATVDAAGDDASDARADTGDAAAPLPPSCREGGLGVNDCDDDGGSCCASPLVKGGFFLRDFDGVHNTNPGNPATVADFRLDQYEVTVGRFRAFVTAFETEAWRPTPGSGIHTAVNDGEGLDMVEDGGTLSETGWSSSWDALLDLPNGLMMCGDPTWGPLPGAHEGDPINCLNWYEAYAFCIWDGGFLPSEAEWDYAAAGGGGGLGQRLYPWSVPSSDASIDCTYANYADAGTGGTCSPDSPVAVGSYPKGAGRWGQMDLSGNVSEFTLDFFPGYPLPCNNCANLIQQQDAGRVLRGGGFRDQYFNLYSAARYYTTATPESDREANYGVRCARNP